MLVHSCLRMVATIGGNTARIIARAFAKLLRGKLPELEEVIARKESCIVAVYKRILSLCVGNRSLLARRYESYRFYSLSVKPRQQKLYVDSNLIRNRHCGTDKQTLSLSAGCVSVDERDRVTCPS